MEEEAGCQPLWLTASRSTPWDPMEEEVVLGCSHDDSRGHTSPTHTSLQEPVFESITFTESRDIVGQSSSEDFIDLPDNGSEFVTLS
jgi:hypothetical protein